MMIKKVISKIKLSAKTYWYRFAYSATEKLPTEPGACARIRLGKKIPDYSLNVFLGESLEALESRIKEDRKLCDKITSQAESAMFNSFLILNSDRPNMLDEESGHYKWHEDFFSGYTFADCCFIDARKQCAGKGVDVKIPWETSRMQYLFSLALAYRITHNEKYVRKIKSIIEDFCVCNRYNVGVNWNTSMEVGIRLANIILACELVQDSSVLDKAFWDKLAVAGYEHRTHLKYNLENPNNGGNHLLADLLGLVAACAAFPFLPGTKTCITYTKKMLHRELRRQTLEDGGNFECSSSYHRLVGELLSFSFIALEKTGDKLSESEKGIFCSMAYFTHSLMMPNKLVPQTGDNDSGRVFQLSPENTRDHRSCVNLLLHLSGRGICFPDISDAYCCFYGDNLKTEQEPVYDSPLVQHNNFGIARYADDIKYLCVCASAPDRYGKAGHVHNDLLSFSLAVGEEEYIVDPGSGEYTAVPDIRNTMRSVRSHSTVSVDGNEQRIIRNDSYLFGWKTKAEAMLRNNISENCYEISGECGYTSSNGSDIKHNRNISIYETSVVIEDEVDGMKQECFLSLPLFPGLSPEFSDGKVILRGERSEVCLSGTWIFEAEDTQYASQYKSMTNNVTLIGKSRSNINTLQISIRVFD